MAARWINLAFVATLATCPALADTTPGLLVRWYDIGQEMAWVPELAPDQLPNIVRVVPTLDLNSERKDFAPLEDNFLTEVVGVLKIDQAGTYTLRLISDDGALLWLDGRQRIDHDGPHGATPKDVKLELTAGEHALRIAHYNGHGDAQLTLQWLPPGAAPDKFELIPPTALGHAADTQRDTAPGQKKIIPPLRRGLPGDGRPLGRAHPGFVANKGAVLAPEPDMLVKNGFVCVHGPLGDDPVAWLPGGATEGDGAAVYTPFPEPYLDQGLVVLPTESLRIATERIGGSVGVTQGAALRFGEGPEPPLKSTGRTVFEVRTVRARANGLEIEFTKPLDPRVGWERESYYVEQWPFDWEGGVGPVRDGVPVPVQSASVLGDRTKVFLEISGTAPSRVYYVRLLPPCLSADGEKPWSTEIWYTMLALPMDLKGDVYPPPAAEPQNMLTEEEKQAGWRLLFDGQTTKGWRGFKKDACPDGWKVINGCLVRVGPGGDIITEEQFEDFELQLEWRISPAGNSGIFFHVSEAYGWPWETGPEMQVLDNAEHADGKNPKTSAGSNYALYAPSKDVTEPIGFFNKVRILVNKGHVEHWLNGVKVVEYELGSPEWEKAVAESKFKDMPHYGREKKGHIDLQDHGDKVWYRNIKIRVLE